MTPKAFFSLSVFALVCVCRAGYRDASLPTAARVEDLLGRMTIVEKVAQLSTARGYTAYEIRGDGEVVVSQELKDVYKSFPGCGLFAYFRADWYSGRNWENGLRPELLAKAHNAIQRYAVENTRLGIPLLFNGSVHGLQVLGATVLPSGIAQAATWSPALVRRGAEVTVDEFSSFARAGHLAGPTQDIAVDPRWCRVEETFGEDPFLSSELTFAYCDGVRSAGSGRYTAQARHFVGHAAGEGGHMNQSVHIGDADLFNWFMPPFVSAVRGGVSHIMTCYNIVDGIPGCLRGDLVNGFLRERLGWNGIVFSDAGAVGNLRWQGFAADIGEAAARVIKSGNDVCCWEKEVYFAGITNALDRGLLAMDDVDAAVRRVLADKFNRGLFEHPYVDELDAAPRRFRSAANRKVSLEMARAGITLLENRRGVLPLKDVKRIAVIGPNADNALNQIGDYTAPQRPGDVVPVRAGMEALGRAMGFEVEYARGCGVRSMRRDGIGEAVEKAARSDAVVLVLGGSSVPNRPIAYTSGGTALVGGAMASAAKTDDELEKDSGEGFDRSSLDLGGVQLELLRSVKKTGKPVVAVLVTGRPVVLSEVAEIADAVLLAWYPGGEGGQAVAEAVVGQLNPGGRLPISFPRNVGQLPVFYNKSRPYEDYVDGPGTPLYAFGYGLSYTRFEVSKPTIAGNVVSVDVRNVGNRDGDDVVQMYIHDDVVTTARPFWELRGFRRVRLSPGESVKVEFPLTNAVLGYYNRRLERVVEPGTFRIVVTDAAAPSGGFAYFKDNAAITYSLSAGSGNTENAKED